MKLKYFKYSKLFFSLILVCSIFRVNGDVESDTWMETDAWAREHLSLSSLQSAIGKCCKCPEDIIHQDGAEDNTNKQAKNNDDTASLIYFKKFITMLFNRKHLKYDSTLQVFERSIIFTLQPSQLDKLEQLQDPRDLDNILLDIFDNVRIPNMYRDCHKLHTLTAASGFKSLVFDIFSDLWQLTKTSEIRFLLIVILVIIIARIFHTRFNIGWCSLIFGGIFIYGYLYTYLECNRELEVNQMLETLNSNQERQEKDSRFIKFLKGIFTSSDSQNLEQQRVKKYAKFSLGVCRPDHVLIMYFNDMFLKYLQLLLEQCTSTLTTLNGTLSFPYNIISGFFLICIIGYILKLTFKYILSPTAWAALVYRKHQHPFHPEQIALSNTNSHNDDRISGENLKLLLNAITAAPQRNKVKKIITAVSGVEELKEAIEAPFENIHPTAETQANTKCNEEIKNVKANIEVEDLKEASPKNISRLAKSQDSNEELKNGKANVTLEDLFEES